MGETTHRWPLRIAVLCSVVALVVSLIISAVALLKG